MTRKQTESLLTAVIEDHTGTESIHDSKHGLARGLASEIYKRLRNQGYSIVKIDMSSASAAKQEAARKRRMLDERRY